MSCYSLQDGAWPTLAAALAVHTVAELEILASAVGVPSAGRKAERIAALCDAVEGERLRFTFGRLDALGRAAVSFALHSRDGRLSWGGFRLRYGAEPDFGTRARWWNGYEKPSLLCLFLHGSRIPGDLAARLRELDLVPPLEIPPVRTTWTLSRDAVVVERMTASAAELQEVLRLLEALPSSSLEPALADASEGALFTKRVRSRSWSQILVAGGLVRSTSKALAMTEEGREALDTPLSETLALLWRHWLAHGEPDEVHGLTGVQGTRSRKAELTDPSERRGSVVDALSECPLGEWVLIDAFLDHVRISGRDFRIAHAGDMIRLDLEGRQVPARVLDDDERFRLLEGRYIVQFLLGVTSVLGIIDVALDPRRAELLAFRLTELGRYCLGLTREPPRLAGTERTALVLDDGLRIRADGPLTASERSVLGVFARKETEGVYRLTRRRALSAIAKRRSIRGFLDFLACGSGAPPPRCFVDFLEDCAARGKMVRPQGAAQLYECRDREMAAHVAEHPSTRSLCYIANDTVLVVPQALDESFRRRIREAGFGIALGRSRGE